MYMDIKILASTKVGYNITKEEALDFSGKSAAICYMGDSVEHIFAEDESKTKKRIDRTLKGGHHSVFEHIHLNLIIENVPKIMAIILNNQNVYATSEKSARYTKMDTNDEMKVIYEKWIKIFEELIFERYPSINKSKINKLAMEKARYLISVFTPATMEYTVSLRQLNYIMRWFDEFIKKEENTDFNVKIKEEMKSFNKCLEKYKVINLNSKTKMKSLNFYDNREKRKEMFDECYSVNYKVSFVAAAQAFRPRTLRHKMKRIDFDKVKFYTPEILKGYPKYKKMWQKDIKSLKNDYPQGMIVEINERGIYEDFKMKAYDRICGHAQREIMVNTIETLEKYIKKTKNEQVKNELLEIKGGPRCFVKGLSCRGVCPFGPGEATIRTV